MSTLPKHSSTCEGTKFSSVVHSQPELEVSKVPSEGKVIEITSSSSQDNLKATKTEITKEGKMGGSMESTHYPGKVMEL